MQRFRVTDRARGSVEVSAPNWMAALGEGMALLGISGQVDRMSAEALPSGQIFVRDNRTGAAYAVLPLEDATEYTEDLDLTEEVILALIVPASASDEAEEVLRAPTLEQATARALDAAHALIASEAGSVVLTRDDGTLYFAAATGPGAEMLANVSLPAGTGIVGFSVDRCTSVALKDAYADPRFFKPVDTVTGTRTRTLLCVPVAAAGKVYGCLELINALGEGGFSRGAMSDACIVADALALRLARG